MSSSRANRKTAFWLQSIKLQTPSQEMTQNHGCQNQLTCGPTNEHLWFPLYIRKFELNADEEPHNGNIKL